MQDELRERLVSHLCLKEVFYVYQVPSFMTQDIEVGCHAYKESRSQAPNEDFMATWMPRRRAMFLIFLSENDQTLIGVGGRTYLAAPEAAVSGFMPPNSCVVAQYTEDDISVDARVPKVLIFDMILLDGGSLRGLDARERYRVLLSSCEVRHSRHLFTLQWVGYERSVISKYHELRTSIPHEVDGIMRLGSDPLHVTRVLPLVTGDPRKAS
jgi:hypothetical protein